jgi:hypothetical protein
MSVTTTLLASPLQDVGLVHQRPLLEMIRFPVRPVFQAPERQISAIIKVGDVAPWIVPLSNSPPEDPTVARESKHADEGGPSPVGRRDAQLVPDLAKMEHDAGDANVAVAATMDGVAQSRRSDAAHALTTAAAASLALKIADRDVEAGVAGVTKKRPFNESESESESKNQPAAATVGCRKRSRRNNKPGRPFNRQTRPPRSTRQTRGAQ